MYVCDSCGANVDASEIHYGICDDCLKDAKEKACRQSALHERIEFEWNGQAVMK